MIKWLLLLALAAAASADMVRLSDGSTLEGEIVAETDTNLTVEVALARGSIVNTRIISKSDVASFARWTPEQKRLVAMQHAYQALAKFAPPVDTNVTVTACDQAIGAIQTFLTIYPGSSDEPELNDRLAQWQVDRQKVAAGMVKFGGVWLTKDEAERRQNRAKAETLLERGNQAFAAKQWSQAVRAFDAVLALHPGGLGESIASRQMTEALKAWRVELAPQLQQLEPELAAAQQRFDRAQKARATRAPLATLNKSASNDGKLGSGPSSDLLHAQSDFTAAEANLKNVHAQADRIRGQLAEIDRRLGATPTPVTAPPAASEPSKDVLDATVSWWKDNWMMLTGILLVGLWLLSRIVSR